MIVIHGQDHHGLTTSERRMVAAARNLPGVLLVNALVAAGRRTREIDGVWVSPHGVVAIEVKGTTQQGTVDVAVNGPWRIGGEVADFAGGPNPLLQARTGAQVLRSHLEDNGVDPAFIPAVVAVSGTAIDCPTRTVGAMTVTDVAALADVVDHLGPRQLGQQDVDAILAALGLSEPDRPDADELTGEGFPPGAYLPQAQPGAAKARATREPGPSSSRERRRARRFADLEEQALRDWRSSHRRRLVASTLALAVLCAVVPHLPFYCVANGVFVAAVVAAYQFAVRRRQSGPREHGPLGVARWLLTLVPVAGVATCLSWIAALPELDAGRWPFVMLLAILLACGVGCAILAGKSSFVHPPAIVIERFDDKGRPTGAFMLAHANPLHFPGKDWRPAPPQSHPASEGDTGG